MSVLELAKLAQGGLLLDLQKKFEGIEFRNIYDLLLPVDRYKALLKEEQQKGRTAPRPTFYKDSTKPSGPRTTAVHTVNIEDINSKERGDEVYLEEEEESAGDLIDRKILKFSKKAAMGVDQNPFPNAQINMVYANFPRPDQPRPRAELEKRQAQVNRLVELQEKLRLEKLELAKADAVTSLEAAATEEMKICRE
ncbi:hypothetical protein L3X38_033306 [Prunus dulcis]|uniref:Uncharacterized protein n=1 Tax=Prunus dulcis TaxID=3755 RepID=A0AAD4YXH4_PRUDU|nr:hypothetical protein L3X38_033306 [Prunus dulcis]